MYTVSEEDMLASMIAYLEEENKTELSSILQVSKFVYSPQWEFSGIVSYQRKLYASLRVPIRCRKIIEDNLQELSKIACQIYIDDDEYYFLGINGVGMLPIQTESLEFEHKHIVLEKDSTFANFIKFIIDNPQIDELQRSYLFEAKTICFLQLLCLVHLLKFYCWTYAKPINVILTDKVMQP